MLVSTPLLVANTGFLLREVIPDDASSYQAFHEEMKVADQYYASLRKYQTSNADGGVIQENVGDQFVRDRLPNQQSHQNGYFFTLCNSNRVPVGYVSVMLKHDRKNDERLRHGFEIGYFIRPKDQGKNLGTLAVAALIRETLTNHGLKIFWATAHPENKASIRVLEKLGMHFEGHTETSYDTQSPHRLLYIGDSESFEVSTAFGLIRSGAF